MTSMSMRQQSLVLNESSMSLRKKETKENSKWAKFSPCLTSTQLTINLLENYVP